MPHTLVSQIEQRLSELKNNLKDKAEEYGPKDLQKVSIPADSPEDRAFYQLMARGIVESFQSEKGIAAFVKEKTADEKDVSPKGRAVLEWLLQEEQEQLLVFLFLANEGKISEDVAAISTLSAFDV